jgi:hypothetical protein
VDGTYLGYQFLRQPIDCAPKLVILLTRRHILLSKLEETLKDCIHDSSGGDNIIARTLDGQEVPIPEAHFGVGG